MKKIENRAELMKIASAAQLKIADGEADALLASVNEILEMCAVIGEFDGQGVEDFSWKDMKAPSRRADVVETWGDRDLFMSQSPTRNGDFFKTPRIMAEG